VRVKLYVLVGVAAALAAYAVGAGTWWGVAVGLTTPALVVIAPRFLRGAITGLQMPGTREDPLQAFSLHTMSVHTMSGTEFEDYVARVARSCGVPVIMTPLTGDWGVDIIIGRRPDRLAVQCKRLSRPVGPGAIQEVVAGAPMQGCTRTMVVSNQEFTPAAQRLAELHECTLVGGSELAQLRSTIRRLTAPVS
jgi:restriction system protein